MVNIKDFAKCKFERAKLTTKKYSPEILLVAGVASLIGGGVVAVIQTTKANDILEDSNKEIAAIKDCKQRAEKDELTVEYTSSDYKKDMTTAYAKLTGKMVKLYAPSIIFAGLGTAAVFTSHGMMKKRYLAMSAACTAANQALEEYRSRVIERLGEEFDKEVRYDIKADEVQVTELKSDGTTETSTKAVEYYGEYFSEYAFIFDEGCPDWKNDADMNYNYLVGVERFLNDQLNVRCCDGKPGRIFLNEIRDAFGLEPTRAGQVMGIEKKNINDPVVINLGFRDIYHEGTRRFVNRTEPNVIIDVNGGNLKNVWETM